MRTYVHRHFVRSREGQLQDVIANTVVDGYSSTTIQIRYEALHYIIVAMTLLVKGASLILELSVKKL